jgi:biotin operon repressor
VSVHVSSWVLRHSEAKLGARLVLLVIADHASDDGTRSWCSVETLGVEARLSRRAVQDALRRLEADGAIVETGKGPKGTHEYRVVMGGADSAPRADTAPKPSLVRKPSDVVTHKGGVQGGAMSPPARVDRKVVTEHEATLAAQVLGAWNRATGQSLRSSTTLGKIVMRLREYPDLGLAEHEHIIDVSLAKPWWTGAPSPSVIYGNDAQFERQLVLASTSATDDLQRTFELVLEAINQGRAT